MWLIACSTVRETHFKRKSEPFEHKWKNAGDLLLCTTFLVPTPNWLTRLILLRYTRHVSKLASFSYSVLIRIVNMLEVPRNWIFYHPKYNKNSVPRCRSIFFFNWERSIGLFLLTFFLRKNAWSRVFFSLK